MPESRRCFPTLILAAGLVALAAGPGAGEAQTSKRSLYSGKPALAKVSSHLMRARALAAADRSAEEIAATVPSLQLRDGLPLVAIRLDSLTPQLVDVLRARGLRVDSFSLEHARAYGRLDPADLEKIAALPEVVTIQPMPRAGTRVGSATNQGDATMNADDVRTSFGYNGTGVEVGVLSDSFRDLSAGSVLGSSCNRIVTGTQSQTDGDLPATVVSLDDGPGGGSDEARAIGELIFDIAPSATFSFHSAFNSPADFAGGITELKNCGADLIVDDVFWTQQAFFQDDIIAQAAQGAVDAGVPYFSAAGNDATFGVDDVFKDGDQPFAQDDFCVLSAFGFPDGHDLHDFDPGPGVDQFAAITVPAGCNIYAELQWDQPFDSIGSSPGSATDLDLYLLSSPVPPDDNMPVPGGNILDSSESFQGGTTAPTCAGNSGDPLEQIFWENNTGGTATVYLIVNTCCSNPTDRFRIVTLSFNCNTTVAPWDFEDGEAGEKSVFVDPQIFGHPAAKDVTGVAAAFFREIDTNGNTDPPGAPQLDVEPFSSLGGDIPFFFDTDGNMLPGAPQTRFKPEVTGPDGTNTSFFGVDIDDFFEPPGDTDPNFFGTSAAAPNSAAIAALILDATDLKINPLPLKQLLEQSAIDMELAGPDDLSGFGFTDALRPIRSLDPSTTPLIDDLEFDLDGGAFFSSPPTSGMQRLQAKDSLWLEDGDFSGLEGIADSVIFADGFESGDTSAWSSSSP